MRHKAVSYIGWYGVLAILSAYALVSFNVVVAKSLPYQFLNLTGAAGIVIEALSKKDSQPAVLNIIWAIIAFVSIVHIFVN